jgi:hypothetical protein
MSRCAHASGCQSINNLKLAGQRYKTYVSDAILLK